tara:strand:- start:39 stop:497 length:459 start_codon:yes stop_codon:yes gene_type:complete
MSIFLKNHIKILLIIFFNIVIGCKLQEPLKTHGIIYLENRSNEIKLDISNKNDVITIMGQPQIKNDDEETWIYIERILSKGKYHKLGQHVIKENNVLVLNFDKYGVLKNKTFYTKEDINKISFSKKNTENELSQKSFVEKFLESMKQKMYRK